MYSRNIGVHQSAHQVLMSRCWRVLIFCHVFTGVHQAALQVGFYSAHIGTPAILASNFIARQEIIPFISFTMCLYQYVRGLKTQLIVKGKKKQKKKRRKEEKTDKKGRSRTQQNMKISSCFLRGCLCLIEVQALLQMINPLFCTSGSVLWGQKWRRDWLNTIDSLNMRQDPVGPIYEEKVDGLRIFGVGANSKGKERGTSLV